MQLRVRSSGVVCVRWLLLAVTLAGGLAAAPARADVEGATHVTVFQESSSADKPLKVVHPQGEVSANTGAVGVNAGYALDIVSGATARVFGESEPDAVSHATSFEDTRHTAHAGLSFETATVGLSAGYSYGWESDYRSHTASVAARGDFLERNLTLALAYTRNFDQVCDVDNSTVQSLLALRALDSSANCFRPDEPGLTAHSLAIHTFEPVLTFTATPLLVLDLGATLQILDGFQANPYRRVLIGPDGSTPQEHLPLQRQRYALFLRARQGLPMLRSSLHAGLRVYRDTWDVMAATADAELQSYLAPALILGLRGRYHQQGGAIFYRTGADYHLKGPAGRYWTGDRELSPFSTVMTGGKIAFLRRRQQEAQALIEELEVNARFDVLYYRLDPGAPNADRSVAFVTQVGLSARF